MSMGIDPMGIAPVAGQGYANVTVPPMNPAAHYVPHEQFQREHAPLLTKW